MQATKRSLSKCLILWDFWVRSPSQWNVSFSLFVWRRLTGMLNCKKIISECGRTLCLPWYNWMVWAYLVVILLLLPHQLIFRFMLFMTHKRKPMLLLFIYAQNTRMVEWKSDCFLLKIVVQHLIPIEVQAELTDNQVLGDSSVPLQGSQPVVNSNPPTGRSRRKAAVRGEILWRELLRLWLSDYLTTEVCQKWGVWESFDWHFFVNILLFLIWRDKYISRD